MPFVSSSATSHHLPSTQPLHSSRPRAMQASAPAPPAPNAIPSIRLISATPSSTVISSSDGGNSTTSSASFARALEDSWDAAAAAAKGPNSSLALAPKVVKAQENAVETTGEKRWYPRNPSWGCFLLHRSRPLPPLPAPTFLMWSDASVPRPLLLHLR